MVVAISQTFIVEVTFITTVAIGDATFTISTLRVMLGLVLVVVFGKC